MLIKEAMKFQNYSKRKVRFETSTFEIGCRQNFVKIKNGILFGQKYSNLGIWAQSFRKPVSNLK